MKTRKCTTGLVVSFFFAAAMVVTLHSSTDIAELKAASNEGASGQPIHYADGSDTRKERKNCRRCGDWVNG